jgi:hypothetical protein
MPIVMLEVLWQDRPARQESAQVSINLRDPHKRFRDLPRKLCRIRTHETSTI